MSEIKAIETAYNGYRFRSRLEARWAVFFDALGIEWEYEKEGYDLGESGWYLPDFWLPDWNTWVEIKPTVPDKAEITKALSLRIQEFTKSEPADVHFFVGDCYPNKHFILDCDDIAETYDRFTQKGITDTFFYTEITECRKCSGICFLNLDEGSAKAIGKHDCGDRWKMPVSASFYPRLMSAYNASRQARFEHGETPIKAGQRADEPMVVIEKPPVSRHNFAGDSDAVAMLGWKRATSILLVGLDRLEAKEALEVAVQKTETDK